MIQIIETVMPLFVSGVFIRQIFMEGPIPSQDRELKYKHTKHPNINVGRTAIFSVSLSKGTHKPPFEYAIIQ